MMATVKTEVVMRVNSFMIVTPVCLVMVAVAGTGLSTSLGQTRSRQELFTYFERLSGLDVDELVVNPLRNRIEVDNTDGTAGGNGAGAYLDAAAIFAPNKRYVDMTA